MMILYPLVLFSLLQSLLASPLQLPVPIDPSTARKFLTECMSSVLTEPFVRVVADPALWLEVTVADDEDVPQYDRSSFKHWIISSLQILSNYSLGLSISPPLPLQSGINAIPDQASSESLSCRYAYLAYNLVILMRDGVDVKTVSPCKVISSTWTSPYDGAIITDSSKIDVVCGLWFLPCSFCNGFRCFFRTISYPWKK